MLLGYGAKVCLRKMRVKAENRMVTSIFYHNNSKLHLSNNFWLYFYELVSIVHADMESLPSNYNHKQNWCH